MSLASFCEKICTVPLSKNDFLTDNHGKLASITASQKFNDNQVKELEVQNETGIRVKENIRIKIGEAKNLVSNSGVTFCKVSLDQEEIFSTSAVAKSNNPLYCDVFQCDIPRKFRSLTFYVCEKTNSQAKVIGKVNLRKEDLAQYNNKEEWFDIQPCQKNSQAQGSVRVDVAVCPKTNSLSEPNRKYRLQIRIVECHDLLLHHGQCNPRAYVVLKHPSLKKDLQFKTACRKKTTVPKFDDVFHFDLERIENKISSLQLIVSIWHEESMRIFADNFLGQAIVSLKDLGLNVPLSAWYLLQPCAPVVSEESVNGGSKLRVHFSYQADHILTSSLHYSQLLQLLLSSVDSSQDISCSAANILGYVCENYMEAAMPLVRIFYRHRKLVDLVKALAEFEIPRCRNLATMFRGTTLLSKVLEELMRLVGKNYLAETLRDVLDNIFKDPTPCEIDNSKIFPDEDIRLNMLNLENLSQSLLDAIVFSGLKCPMLMCQAFSCLKDIALRHFPSNHELSHQVVSAFIFLRFFTPAINGPKLFGLCSQFSPGATTSRTLLLLAKTIQYFGNVVCSPKMNFDFKEEWMIPLLQRLANPCNIEAVKSFLDIVSTLTRNTVDVNSPVVLKDGLLNKNCRRFGLKNFNKRYFCLTTHYLKYGKSKNGRSLCEIPVKDIVAVKPISDSSFSRKYMLQVIQRQRTLYLQAQNCIEESEWKHVLNRVCNVNQSSQFHPGSYVKGQWHCCKEVSPDANGCVDSAWVIPTDLPIDIDCDQQLERVYNIFRRNELRLHSLCEEHDPSAVRTSKEMLLPLSHDESACFPELNLHQRQQLKENIQSICECILHLQAQHHLCWTKRRQQAILGSQEFPFGDDSYEDLLRVSH